MPTEAKTTAPNNHRQDAISLLTADHRKVEALFAEFDELKDEGSDEEKAAIVEQICDELNVHAQVEEEIFYPAVRKAIDDADKMDEALVEHAGAKELIFQLSNANPEDALYDAKVTVLGEQIAHHVDEEEGTMFPQAKNTDVEALGTEMLKRQAELKRDWGVTKEGQDQGDDYEGFRTRSADRR